MWDKKKNRKTSSIINKVFKYLNTKSDWVARRDWTCCNTCGWVELEQEYEEKDKKVPENVVFYHLQETESFKDRGVLYLNWSGDWRTVKVAFELHGCKVEAEGNENKKIIVDFRDIFAGGADKPLIA